MVEAKVSDAKREKVDRLAGVIAGYKGFVAVDYRGITVAEISRLRDELRKLSSRMTVIKNSELSHALLAIELDITGDKIAAALVGPTALVFVEEDFGPVFKLLLEEVREDFFLTMKAAYIEGQIYDGEQIKMLAKLPSKGELLAQLLGTLNAPVQQLAAVMNAVPSALVRVLNAAGEKIAGDS